jgi:dGTPase
MNIATPEDVRMAGRHLVQFSAPTLEALGRLRAFLYERMYRHYRVNRTRSQAKRIVSELFALFMREPEVLPTEWSDKAHGRPEAEQARAVCDYIAGMTDRYAIEEHRRLFRLEVGHDL